VNALCSTFSKSLWSWNTHDKTFFYMINMIYLLQKCYTKGPAIQVCISQSQVSTACGLWEAPQWSSEAGVCEGSSWTTREAAGGKDWNAHENRAASDSAAGLGDLYAGSMSLIRIWETKAGQHEEKKLMSSLSSLHFTCSMLAKRIDDSLIPEG
jgi:hypothetical protein